MSGARGPGSIPAPQYNTKESKLSVVSISGQRGAVSVARVTRVRGAPYSPPSVPGFLATLSLHFLELSWLGGGRNTLLTVQGSAKRAPTWNAGQVSPTAARARSAAGLRATSPAQDPSTAALKPEACPTCCQQHRKGPRKPLEATAAPFPGRRQLGKTLLFRVYFVFRVSVNFFMYL